MAKKKTSGTETGAPPELTDIARTILLVSGIGITAVAVVTLVGAAFVGKEQFAESSKTVFNALLPLMGT